MFSANVDEGKWMIRCHRCNVEKDEEEFSFRNKELGTRHFRCRDCTKAYSAQHYRQNKPSYIKRGMVNGEAKRRELLDKLYTYLRDHPCVDCREADPLVLDFDHLDSATKFMSVSNLRVRCYSWKRILQEIEKCEVRCANCHRRKTAQQFGWCVPEWYVHREYRK